jgi:hypothetical protein
MADLPFAMSRRSLCLLALALFPAAASAQDKPNELARAAHDILQKACYECHQPGSEAGGLDVTDRNLLFRTFNERGNKVRPFVVAEKPEESLLIEVISGANPRMPQSGPLPDKDRQILVDWITAGAPEALVLPAERPRVGNGEIIQSIQNFLISKVAPEKQQFRVFFSLAHLHNNPRIFDRELRLYRAALSKAINSLSRHNRVVVPDEVDAHGTVYSVDIQQLGWMKNATDFALWQKVLAEYPYAQSPANGLRTRTDFDAYTRLTQNRILGRVNQGIPYIHADWFVSVVTRSDADAGGSKLYYELLDIPTTVAALETRLGVTRNDDVKNGRVRRAGVIISGVSAQNRVVDLHPTANQGGYWISYDFKLNNGKGNIVRFPLGPNFEGNDFNDFAFDHAGGEVIFRLANGLHGYMLIDTAGARIDKGPVEIVRDLNQASGTPEIVNGLSCMTCHAHGMVRFKEAMRDSLAVSDKALNRANEIFFEQNALDDELADETRAYLDVLDRAIGKFLKVGEDATKDISRFPEPVGFVAKRYSKDLGATEAALELGLIDARELNTGISISDALQKLGLGPLAAGRTIKRTYWSAREADGSPYQQTAKALNRGVPIVISR